jgi:hypothetical protein
MAVGGSPGHSGWCTVDVLEGVFTLELGGRGWKVRTGFWNSQETEDGDD